ncbi:hypothetical protein [Curtobacterium sp. MCBD17_040]|uniref:hypothetical protein n=1 Tax=Curtobacterium sp. MCBD17_040 TaxID=2175674 RepID=UPI000DAAC501|nr:hypothetical protein [Curtobacterium sp. MCBD17_040]WIB65416.1 hypothetical protein DEI94_18590 [Curtobacterium sp. MCBD17_040]
MTVLDTDAFITLRADSNVHAHHPRFAATGPFRTIVVRDLPGAFGDPLVHRVLLESVTEPGLQVWVSDTDIS